jgi:hypothetical protein
MQGCGQVEGAINGTVLCHMCVQVAVPWLLHPLLVVLLPLLAVLPPLLPRRRSPQRRMR